MLLHHDAAAKGDTATAALLVEKGADVHAMGGVSNTCVDVQACCGDRGTPSRGRGGSQYSALVSRGGIGQSWAGLISRAIGQ